MHLFIHKEMKAKTQRNILIVIVLLLLAGVGYGYHKYSQTRTALEISQQNKKALGDSVRAYKDSMEYTKQILVSKKEKIGNLNKKLSEEIQNTDGDVHHITNTEVKIEHDTIKDTIRSDDKDSTRHFDIYRDYENNNSLTLKGRTTPENVFIDKHEIGVSITSGLRTRNDSIELFVRSKHPGFKVEELHSAMIDPNSHPAVQKFSNECRDPWKLGFGVSVEGNKTYFDFAPRISVQKSNIDVGYEFNILNKTHEISIEKKVDLN